jgi:hypothetical protein
MSAPSPSPSANPGRQAHRAGSGATAKPQEGHHRLSQSLDNSPLCRSSFFLSYAVHPSPSVSSRASLSRVTPSIRLHCAGNLHATDRTSSSGTRVCARLIAAKVLPCPGGPGSSSTSGLPRAAPVSLQCPNTCQPCGPGSIKSGQQ